MTSFSCVFYQLPGERIVKQNDHALLILDANPLENIRNTQSIHWVMKNGRLYEGDSLSEVWPQTRPGPTRVIPTSP